MKILAIRGENLASIAGRFEVLLDQPPLANAGLFAITGPTGAGKSTLLDAICLALFDQMPRFDGRGGALLGRPDEDVKTRLASRDVRSILRRGTGSAFAEVDYVGRGGARFRARWSVQRAHKKAYGGFQHQEMSLIDLGTGRLLATKRTEVVDRIQETLGLTYDQFRRSALLAQGDFAAFLRATEEERSNLLEQMTGTEVYTRLSIAAHERFKEAREEVDQIERELGAMQLLAAEQLVQLEQRLEELSSAWKEADETIASAEAAQRWHAHRRELTGLAEKAVAEQQAASAALIEAAPLREELAHVERAHRVKPLLEAAKAAEEALAKAIQRRDDLACKALATARRGGEATRHRVACEEAHQKAKEALERMKPTLDAAARLDAEVAEAERRLDEAAKRAQEAQQALSAASEQTAQITERIQAAIGRLHKVDAWLAENPGLEALATQWPRWEQELKRYAAALRDERAAEDARAQIELDRQSADQRVHVAKDALRQAEETRIAAENTAREAEELTHRQALTDAVREEREALLARRDRLLPLDGWIAQALREEEIERAESAQTERRRAEAKAAGDAARAEQARAERLQIQHDEANGALRQARARQDLASHRAALQEGEPCPLCGATEHPYAKDEALVGLVDTFDARVKALQGELLDAQNAAATRGAQATAYEMQAEESAGRAQRARKALDETHTAWARAAGELGLDAPEPNARGREKLQGEVAAIRVRIDEINALERHAAKLAKEARRRRDTAEASRKIVAQAQETLDSAKKASAEVARLVERNASDLARAREVREEAGRELIAPLDSFRPGWQEAIAANARGFVAECRGAVTERDARTAERTQLATDLAGLKAQRETAVTLEEERREHAQQRAREHTEKESRRTALRVRRGELLDGRPTSNVRSELEAQLESRLAQLEQSRAAEQDDGALAARAEAEAQMAQEAAEEHAAAAQRATETLVAKLTEEGVERGAIEARLKRSSKWMETTRADLRQRDRTAAAADAVLAERTRARKEHEASGPPPMTEDEATKKKDEAAAERDNFHRQRTAVQLQLEHDQLARREQADKIQRLEACRAVARRWGEMDELIGASDGKKFRVFAQSLTLDALLLHANEHLEEFAPRYRLMRVPEHDLDLQIEDQDMAGEIRSVNSLSGGESFLVSLALALGLSALSAQDVCVETLFVDEGLASLDPEALDAAVASLEVLQGTGRQVGVISHVVSLAEQIGTEVRLERLGGGRSRVMIAGGSNLEPAPLDSAPEISAPRKRTRKRVPLAVGTNS